MSHPPPATRTWRAALAEARAAVGDPDGRHLVERASGHDDGRLALHLDEQPTPEADAHLHSMLVRRRQGEPLQYVLGRWAFRRLDLFVDRRVLIPRPETEQVVEVALDEVRRLVESGAVAEPLVVDLGTGSGAIALSVATEVPTAAVWATDRSSDALSVARANLAGIGRPAARVRVVAGDWFEALPADLAGTIDLVVSNPPYVGAQEALPAEVSDWEPDAALRAGPSGAEALEHLIDTAPRWLAPHGVLVLELAPPQAPALVERAHGLGYRHVALRSDLAGRARALVARRS